MSERTLAYSEEPLVHRMLVLFEAAGIQGEIGAYLLRSLISEGMVRYETVVKTESGPESRLIERPGPTGVILTTTATRLHPENETRLLSIPVSDSAQHTRAVLRSIAARKPQAAPKEQWHALQLWLARLESKVRIPFAEQLAELVPPVAVRLRRDFGQVLQLVSAHALLHRATRRLDADGFILAEPRDYEAVRELVSDLVASGIGAAVPVTVREAVNAVGALSSLASGSTVSVTELAKALSIDKSSASRRARHALDLGHLKNEETRKGFPSKLVLGEPMPEELEILPPASALYPPEGCAVAPLVGGASERLGEADSRDGPSRWPVTGHAMSPGANLSALDWEAL